jgi:hypothetical protein
MIIDEGCNKLRVLDPRGNRILDIDEANPEQAADKLMSYESILSSYGRLTVKGGDELNLKQNFSNGYQWQVGFNNAPAAGQNNFAMNGNVSQQQLQLATKVKELELTILFNDKFKALEDKLQKKNDLPIPMEYLPFIGEFLGWDDEKMFRKLQMSSMAGNLSGLNSMMKTQTPAKPKLTIEGTAEEKNKIIESTMTSLAAKVDIDKMIALLTAVNNNPKFVDQALSFITMTNPQALAGLNKTKSEKDFGTVVIFEEVKNHNDENF